MTLSSSWRSGSPPVQTTYFRTRLVPKVCSPLGPTPESVGVVPPIQHRSTASASSSPLLKRPPSGPVPTKSVSQNLQTARDLSSSRPDQRLHPEKRQKTAARPA